MAENSGIEWTDHTFNPWLGCTKVSPACANCYAERDFDHRYKKVQWGPQGTRVLTSDSNWKKPLQWNRKAEQTGYRLRVFCASLADVFEDWEGAIMDHSRHRLSTCRNSCGLITTRSSPSSKCAKCNDELRPLNMGDARRRLFHLIDLTPNLDWLLLTKRPENVERMWPTISSGRKWNSQNVWLGTSIENQEWADKRLPHLHAAKRYGLVRTTFISAEPLVGSIILQGQHDGKTYNHLGEGGIDWVITGGESGPNARPCDPDWFRSLRDQCNEAGTAFHFKQWGEFNESQTRVGKKSAGRLLDGVTHDGLPKTM